MSRYIIIDTSLIPKGESFVCLEDWWVNYKKGILSEKESLAKFKEVFDAGYESGNADMENNIAGFTKVPDGVEWEEYSKTL